VSSRVGQNDLTQYRIVPGGRSDGFR
jgi:hypothetical protein